MLEQILSRYPQDRTSLVMILQDLQSEFGYLPQDALEEISTRLEISRAQVYSVATFYNVLSLKPRGRHLIRVCMGTACHVRQGSLILAAAERELGIKDGETSADGEFTLQSVGCVGACAIGPVVEVDEEHFGHMNVQKMSRLIRKIKKRAASDTTSAGEERS
ncbi:MAG: NADH-quinone oxidoreductase subunit NuoE [bacterium]|nr:NADH-quinone oxidoreductase subunit NuoE [bacterium]